MGKYTFTWPSEAKEVIVTGDFDAWGKTVKLEKEDGVFKKTVEIPKAKHQYKFFVDGEWLTNDSLPKEAVDGGIFNNVLSPDDVVDEPVGTLSSAAPESSTAALAGQVATEEEKKKKKKRNKKKKTPAQSEEQVATLSSVAPDSSTAALAADVPKEETASEKKDEPVSTLSSAAPESSTAALAADVPKEEEKATKSEDSLPGAFPLTPPTETPGTEPQTFSVNPIPVTEGPGNPIQLAPGEKVPDPSTLTSNTVQSTVKDDNELKKEEDATVSVAPIPATAGPGNPIHLEPGEKVPDPSTLTSNTIDSTVKTDAASYENSDRQAPQLDPLVMTPEAEREAKGDPGVFIQSAAPTSTTAALAAEVPKETTDVPAAVTESQKQADFPPEATTNAEAVHEKAEVEAELKEKVLEEPPAAESGDAKQTAGIAAGATAAAGAFAAATYAAKDKAAEAIGANGQATVTEKAKEAVGLNGQATTAEVPEVVTESQKEAHASPEAAANKEAVQEKKEVEAELLKEVKPTDEAGEPAPAVSAALAETAPAPTTESTPAPATETKTAEVKSNAVASSEVPAVVAESQKDAHASPEAAANIDAVEDKKQVEAELLQEVKKTDATGEPAPAAAATTAEAAPAKEPEALNAPASKPAQPEPAKAAPADSRDVSPMTKQPPVEQTQPKVTTGTETTTTDAKTEAKSSDAKAATPAESKSTPEAAKATPTSSKDAPQSENASPAAGDKKKKRLSFFGKLKAKLKDL